VTSAPSDRVALHDGHLVLYRRERSPFAYYDIKLPGQPRIRKSTEKTTMKEGIVVGEERYQEAVVKTRFNIPLKDLSVREIAHRWIADIRDDPDISERRLKDIQQVLDTAILPYFGDMPITGITDKQMADYRRWRKKVNADRSEHMVYELNGRIVTKRRPATQLKPVKDTTINRQLETLRGLFKWARIAGLMERHQVPEINTVNTDENTVVWFSLDEYKTLRRVAWKRALRAKQFDERYSRRLQHLFIVIAISSGLRITEAARLTWGDIEAHRNGVLIWARGKGKRRQVVPMRWIKVYLDRLRILTETTTGVKVRSEDKVFPVTAESIGRAFGKVVREADLETNPEGEKRVPGSLRHSAISWLILYRELDPYRVAMWAGTTTQMIEEHYGRKLQPQMLLRKKQDRAKPVIAMTAQEVIAERLRRGEPTELKYV
jgi:integrase